MRDNYNLSIVGVNVELVPYRKKHVMKYHEWMKHPEILEATASEPLSLEEEYAMQMTWRDDSKKCTFIVLAKQEGEGCESEMDRMAGDVNLFMHDHDDPGNAEIEIMIAEPRLRRKGLATEALLLMMSWGIEKIGIQRFFAKIHETNDASIALFSSLGFKSVNYVKAFGEYEFEFCVKNNEDSAHVLSRIHEARQSSITKEYFPFEEEEGEGTEENEEAKAKEVE